MNIVYQAIKVPNRKAKVDATEALYMYNEQVTKVKNDTSLPEGTKQWILSLLEVAFSCGKDCGIVEGVELGIRTAAEAE
jgi:hypothetical protein